MALAPMPTVAAMAKLKMSVVCAADLVAMPTAAAAMRPRTVWEFATVQLAMMSVTCATARAGIQMAVAALTLKIALVCAAGGRLAVCLRPDLRVAMPPVPVVSSN